MIRRIPALLLLALVACLLPSHLDAQTAPPNVRVSGVTFTPVAAGPFAAGQTGIWWKSADNRIYQRLAGGADAVLSPSGTYLPLAGGTMTGNIYFDPLTYIGTVASEPLQVRKGGADNTDAILSLTDAGGKAFEFIGGTTYALIKGYKAGTYMPNADLKFETAGVYAITLNGATWQTNTLDAYTANCAPGDPCPISVGFTTTDGVKLGKVWPGAIVRDTSTPLGSTLFGVQDFGQTLGYFDVTATSFGANSAVATGGATTKDPTPLTLTGSYWNGAAAVSYAASIMHDVTGTGPASKLSFSFGGAEKINVQNTGEIQSAASLPLQFESTEALADGPAYIVNTTNVYDTTQPFMQFQSGGTPFLELLAATGMNLAAIYTPNAPNSSAAAASLSIGGGDGWDSAGGVNATAGGGLEFLGGEGGSGAAPGELPGAGGAIAITGGAAGWSDPADGANGGNVAINAGTGSGTGADGTVTIGDTSGGVTIGRSGLEVAIAGALVSTASAPFTSTSYEAAADGPAFIYDTDAAYDTAGTNPVARWSAGGNAYLDFWALDPPRIAEFRGSNATATQLATSLKLQGGAGYAANGDPATAGGDGTLLGGTGGAGSGSKNPGAGGTWTIQGGAAGVLGGFGGANGGGVSLQAGAATGTGTDGVISIGTTTASSVGISKSGVTTTVYGALSVSQNATAARYYTGGTALVAGDFAVNALWGATASVGTVSGNDSAFTLVVTAAGAGVGPSPVTTLNFKNGNWSTAPICLVQLVGSDDGAIGNPRLDFIPLVGTLAWTMQGTPVAGKTYTFAGVCIGK